MRHIRVAGFGGVIECGYKMVDNHLVTALVERWRPKTHTFHFKFGETTIILEDVQVLWGMPIGDKVVSGRDTRLTFPEQRLTRLTAELGNDFPDDASEDNCVRRARLSWARAVLAYIFKNLCKGTSSKAIEIYGPTMLLQLWAWERISPVSPTRSMEYQSGKAYGSRWNCHLSFREIPNYALSHYRSQLQSLQTYEFNWMSYFQVEDLLLECCLSGKDSWRCDTALIFWEVVEPHLPSKVMSQFGMSTGKDKQRIGKMNT
ncbi:serine/threonine-protein phosphatase 7 long form homolog [Bidens hawaiensis]|uniref:serine/threonine-protein phosphatase 7 long form homolog n=1 Tax=Bidens hawaiensis TaxID=980011 RepID=UPI00404B6CD2